MWIAEYGRRIVEKRRRKKAREETRILCELIKNESPEEKKARNHKNRSEAQTRRRSEEFWREWEK